ncbi:MAG: hypothetical protein GTO62_14025, partial [Planctomycetales bacterium]|nr:hypothetical protein [Planctomycetales bacterium]
MAMIPTVMGCSRFRFGPGVQKVPAEFAGLEGKRTLVLVWAEPETLDQYPRARLDVANHVGDKLRAHLRDAAIIDPQVVEKHLTGLKGS